MPILKFEIQIGYTVNPGDAYIVTEFYNFASEKMLAHRYVLLYCEKSFCIFPKKGTIRAIIPPKRVNRGNMGYIGKNLTLAVETSGRNGSAAVGIGDKVLAKRTLSGRLRHGSELLTCCSDLIKTIDARPSDIKSISISAGPGSFTGIRIAVTIAKMMNFACDAKIIPLSTMDVIAENVPKYAPSNKEATVGLEKPKIESIATILDAKRGQFYIAIFERRQGRWQKSLDDCLMTSSQFLNQFAGGEKTIYILGEGLVYYADQFAGDRITVLDESCWYPQAENVYKLGTEKAKQAKFADPLTLTPHYLRGPQAVVKQRT